MNPSRIPTVDMRLAGGGADEFAKMGTYVASSDMSGSVEFYQAIFERQPIIRVDGFVAFDIAGGLFAIVARARYAAGSIPGSGSVPCIAVENLEMVRARAATILIGPVPDVIVEPGIRLLKLHDPDHQLVEFYCLTST